MLRTVMTDESIDFMDHFEESYKNKDGPNL